MEQVQQKTAQLGELWPGVTAALSFSAVDIMIKVVYASGMDVMTLVSLRGILVVGFMGIWLWMLANKSLPRSAWVGLGAAFAFGILEIEMRAMEMQTFEAPIAASQPLIAPVIVWLIAVGIIIACTRWPEIFTPRAEAGRSRLKLAGKVTYPLYLVHSAAGATTMRWLIVSGMPPYLALLEGVQNPVFLRPRRFGKSLLW